MRSVRLGQSGPVVSALGYGCLSLTQYYGPGASETDALRLIDHAIERGITLFDTAPMYGGGINERLLGRAIAGRRSGLAIATKFGALVDAHGRPTGIDGTPRHVRASCDESLARLGLEAIDLFLQHRLDRAVPIEETVGAMAELVRDGKVRHLGLCEVSAETIRRAHRVHPIAAIQSEYSLWSRDPEATVLPACRELGIGFMAYSPLGRGFLAGSAAAAESLPADDARRGMPRFQLGNFAANHALLASLAQIAAGRGCTPGQAALAWLCAQGVVPIPGTKRIAYLDENLGALDVALTAEDLAELDAAFPPGRAAGRRVSDASMRFIDA